MISVYADGSSSGRSDEPGGYGWLILNDGEPLLCGYGGDPSTTNNRMELMGALQGLLAVKHQVPVGGRAVELVCDSQYVLGIASGRSTPLKNVDLCVPLRALFRELGAVDRWVRGHSKEPWNERCDRFAKKGKLEAQEELLKSYRQVT